MLISKIAPHFLFAADDGGGSGDLPDSVVKAFEKLLDRKGGDASAVAQMLFVENKEYRDKISALTGKVPPEGSVVLTTAEAADWKAYRELGAVAVVKQGLDERTDLQGKLDAVQNGATLRTVAEVAGFKSSVLIELERMAKAQGKALAFSVREQTVDGKTVKTAIVKDGDKESDLKAYASEQWSDFLPALSAADNSQSTTEATPAPGLRFPTQHPGGSKTPAATDLVDKFVTQQTEKAKAAPNPLLKK